jgi:hypothetical protein
VELSPKYAKMSARRLERDALTREHGGEAPKTEAEEKAMKAQMRLPWGG